jgi:hypothetical protein
MTLVWRPGYGGAAVSDPDAMAYLQAVEVADNQALEQGVQQAVNQFVIGCKADGIWNAIKASCILAGARTLTGALVPLAGAAPTNFNFVAGDYNRKTGLVGDGSTKYLDSNYSFVDELINNKHIAVNISSADTGSSAYIGAANSNGVDARTQIVSSSGSNILTRCSSSSSTITNNVNVPGLISISRSISSQYILRANSSSVIISNTSVSGAENNVNIFRRNISSSPIYITARLAFYSIGESLDLALLDARVTTLINAFAAAIP